MPKSHWGVLFAIIVLFVLWACFENISGGFAAGRGGWLRCSSIEDARERFSFVKSEQIKGCPLCGLPRHPPLPAAIPFPIYFQNTLFASMSALVNPPAFGYCYWHEIIHICQAGAIRCFTHTLKDDIFLDGP
jgi:hypothetical protein